MLQEMGVTVWAPAPASAPVTPVAPGTPPLTAAAMPAPAASAQRATGAGMGPSAALPPAVPAPTARTQQSPAAAPSPGNASASDAAAPGLRLHAPQPLYPSADPAQTPSGLGGGWLLVAESTAPQTPLEGDAGRLLDNMLRAMQLHRHPRVFLAALERVAPGAPPPSGTEVAAALAQAVAELRPAMVLVLGHVAARAALGRPEPLGRLRAEVHQLAGCPAVVTYDPAFLLRSQDNKAAAWADLCRALAMVRKQSSSSD